MRRDSLAFSSPSTLSAFVIAAFVIALLMPGLLRGQDLASFEKRVTVKTLPNGLTLLLCQRSEAPVFSIFTHVDAGDAQDPKGQTGLAHMFEHMAFKGTDKIGTNNWPAEKAALQKVEKTYHDYFEEQHREVGRDDKKVEALKQAWEAAREQAQKYVNVNQFSEILERSGAEDLNAFTSMDETGYTYSLPVNRLELFAYMESSRFAHPVMREFYKERDVVYEERRMRVDSDPIGRLVEQFVSSAYEAHPYRNEGIGWPSDISSFSATDAENFFHQYYVPANMVVTVVGDLKPQQALPVLEKYFSQIPAHPKPDPLRTVEPPQRSQRTVVIREASQPVFIEGYHRPSFRDPDDAVYDVISDLLSNGRTSRLYRSLVRDKKIAAQASGFTGFPGNKYPNLFSFFVIPSKGHTPQEIGDAVHAEIDRLVSQDVTDEELKMVKTRAKADLIRGLANNAGLAQQLATYQALYGDWRELFRDVDRIEKVSKQDIRRVAAKTFVVSNRTTAVIENGPASSSAAEAK